MGYSSSWQVSCRGRSMRQLATSCDSQEVERCMPAISLLTPGMLLPISKVGLPSSVKSFRKHPQTDSAVCFHGDSKCSQADNEEEPSSHAPRGSSSLMPSGMCPLRAFMSPIASLPANQGSQIYFVSVPWTAGKLEALHRHAPPKPITRGARVRKFIP